MTDHSSLAYLIQDDLKVACHNIQLFPRVNNRILDIACNCARTAQLTKSRKQTSLINIRKLEGLSLNKLIG